MFSGSVIHPARIVGYLPPYSPDLNPIEQLFAKLKGLLRKAAARTVSTLWAAIGALIEIFGPDELANHFRHAGYGSAVRFDPDYSRSSILTSAASA